MLEKNKSTNRKKEFIVPKTKNGEIVKAHEALSLEQREMLNSQLIVAARKGDNKMIEFLIKEGADINAKSNDNNWTPLIWASYFGHRDIVKLLISKDADVNAKSFDNNTALTYASLLGFKEIVKDLIDAGADVNVSNIHVGLR